MEEFIDEVDKNGKVIATHPKKHWDKQHFMHKGTIIIPRTKGNKFLFAKRSKSKHPFPNTWFAEAWGKAISGETEEETAIREMKEEIGKAFPLKKVVSVIYDDIDFKCIFTIFTTINPISENELVLDPKEIQYVKAFSIKEIMELLNNHPQKFAPTFRTIMKEFAKHYK